jgi:hypothetical protein
LKSSTGFFLTKETLRLARLNQELNQASDSGAVTIVVVTDLVKEGLAIVEEAANLTS